MISKSSFKKLLTALGFTANNDIYSKKINNESLQIDFDQEKLIYPKGVKIEGQFTTNFSSNENFVVFECVHRLLTIGYKPEHLTLEPKWKLGHGASGGRADIVISNNEGAVFGIIECKTAGHEFEDAWSAGLQYPSQLFSYAQQEGSTQVICLYTSDFVNDKVENYYYVIPLVDNQNFLQTVADENLATYRKANRYDELFNVWKNTYQQEAFTTGFLEEDIQPFQLGRKNYSIKDLKDIGHADIQKKYHEFATILRKYNVSGRENAFDKLVNLFLCKVVDEKENPANLKFYWRGLAYDTHFDLQDRLQLLYQQGMRQFLGEEVTYINQEKIDEAFRFLQDDPDATKETINNYFKQLKFFTNNDFAFIDVHNEKLFYQNAVILLRIVEMLQDIRLKNDKDEHSNQFLGDMFEGFLDAGVKQSEGQFFTPMPIVKFIMNSLPLEQIIANSDQPPKAIDYACGAGHFLTELAKQLKPVIKKYKTDAADVKNYYRHITGIEKEYRLSKVAKVSAFMYGQDDINIIYADALARNSNIAEGEYQILVANPPYSVKGFLETLSMTDKRSYELYSGIDNKSLSTNNAIETFFIERAKQLLAPEGVAAIILPSSVLSNEARQYQQTREILLKYFHIVAIAELGSGTFGKTGTNTVTLFLRRRKTNPAEAEHFRNRVSAWLQDADFEPTSKRNIAFKDLQLLETYCHHIGIGFTDYKQLWQNEAPNEAIEKSEIWQEYSKAFYNRTEVKNLQKRPVFKRLDATEQQEELNRLLYRHVRNIEMEKLYYFLLANSNAVPVLIIKSPADNKAMKKFLGYEWSAAKGNEGIKYLNTAAVPEPESEDEPILINAQLNAIQTPLYNPAQTEDQSKLNYYIGQNFLGNSFTIPEELAQFARTAKLSDMIDFSRRDFYRIISLTSQRVFEIVSKWERVKLNELVSDIGGLWTGKKQPLVTARVIRNTNFGKEGKLDLSDVALIDVETNQFNNRRLQQGDIIIEKSGGSETQAVGRVVLFNLDEGNYSFSNFTARLRVENNKINNEFLFLVLNDFYNKGLTFSFQSGASGLKNLDLQRYLEIKVPVPPEEVQQNIVAECRVIDEAITDAKQTIYRAKEQIELSINFNGNKKIKLRNIVSQISESIDPSLKDGKVVYIGLENIEKHTGQLVGDIHHSYNDIKSVKTVFQKGDILFGKLRPNLNKVYLSQYNGVCSTDILVLRPIESKYSKLYAYYLRSNDFNEKVVETIAGLRMPRTSWDKIESINIPEFENGKGILQQIEILEAQIATAQNIIKQAPAQKQQVLKKWLE